MQHVLLCIRPKLLRDAIRARLCETPGVKVVGEVDNELDLLLAIRATRATCVIHAWPGDALPGVYTHLFAEYPGLSILGLTPDGEHAWHCEQRIVQTELPQPNLDTVVQLLSHRHADAAVRASA